VAVDESGDVLADLPSPPYILTFPKSRYSELQADSVGDSFVSPGVKSLVGDSAATLASSNDDAILVQSYNIKANGPYAVREAKKNSVPFTPTQGFLCDQFNSVSS
jgi:hypothetical protein